MSIIVTGLSCCAGRQIHGLTEFGKNAKKAMLAFCRVEFHRNNRYINGAWKLDTDKFSPIYTFYLFNGIVGYRKGSLESDPDRLGYVEAFRDFIRANDLGEVVESETGFNRVNNPTHNILMCMWKPRPVVLKKWYVENR